MEIDKYCVSGFVHRTTEAAFHHSFAQSREQKLDKKQMKSEKKQEEGRHGDDANSLFLQGFDRKA